jgi:hypothetical protein
MTFCYTRHIFFSLRDGVSDDRSGSALPSSSAFERDL